MPDRGTAQSPSSCRPESDFRDSLLQLLPHLRAFARGLCSGRTEQADDLVQDTIVRAWTARQNYAQGTNLKAWVFTIMRNHFLNSLRKAKRETPLDPDVPDHNPTIAADQEDGLHLSDLQSALDALPQDRREALLLVGAGGMSYEEAAGICGAPVGTIKSRVARGRQQLAEILAASTS